MELEREFNSTDFHAAMCRQILNILQVTHSAIRYGVLRPVCQVICVLWIKEERALWVVLKSCFSFKHDTFLLSRYMKTWDIERRLIFCTEKVRAEYLLAPELVYSTKTLLGHDSCLLNKKSHLRLTLLNKGPHLLFT